MAQKLCCLRWGQKGKGTGPCCVEAWSLGWQVLGRNEAACQGLGLQRPGGASALPACKLCNICKGIFVHAKAAQDLDYMT